MGSGAFLNEAAAQLAQHYLELKQKQLQELYPDNQVPPPIYESSTVEPWSTRAARRWLPILNLRSIQYLLLTQFRSLENCLPQLPRRAESRSPFAPVPFQPPLSHRDTTTNSTALSITSPLATLRRRLERDCCRAWAAFVVAG